jgi:hypothetical protein
LDSTVSDIPKNDFNTNSKLLTYKNPGCNATRSTYAMEYPILGIFQDFSPIDLYRPNYEPNLLITEIDSVP